MLHVSFPLADVNPSFQKGHRVLGRYLGGVLLKKRENERKRKKLKGIHHILVIPFVYMKRKIVARHEGP